jgi:ABC-type transport system substrate-binding protein
LTRQLMVAGLLVMALAACELASPSGSVPASGSAAAVDQILSLAYTESGTLDPHVSPETTVSLLVRGLTWFDEDLGMVAGLAETWDVSLDGLRVTFHLRDAQYSSGEPITADDFLYGWRRLLDPRTGSRLGYLLADVAGAGALLGLPPDAAPTDAEIGDLLDGLGLAAPDPRTLEVTLIRPAAYFTTAVANPALAPMAQEWITRPGATEADGFWSSGPFVLTEWVHDQRRTLQPNPSWWGEPVGLERIEMRTFPSEADAATAFGGGEIDILDVSAPPDDSAPSGMVREKPGTAFWHIEFDRVKAGSPTAESQALRRALSLAIDRDTLNEIVGFSGPAAGSPIPPGVPGHDPELESVFDPDEARSSLDEALAELGLDDPADLELTFLHGTLVGDGPRYLEQQWHDILGIDVAFTGLESEQYFERLFSRGHEFDMFWLQWFADYPHPQTYLEPLWACQSATNLSGYCNPEFDTLLAEGAATIDETAQLARYGEAQRMLVEEATALFLQWPGGYALVNPRVEGLVITPLDAQYGMLFPERIRIVAD